MQRSKMWLVTPLRETLQSSDNANDSIHDV